MKAFSFALIYFYDELSQIEAVWMGVEVTLPVSNF